MELVKKDRRIITLLSILILLSLIIILNSSTPAQTSKRVKFTYGKANVTFSDSAKIGEKDTYVIKLKKGQSCQIDVQWLGEDIDDRGQGLSGFTIVYPNGEKLIDPQDGYTQADLDGDYKVIVSPRFRKTNYRYRIVFTRY